MKFSLEPELLDGFDQQPQPRIMSQGLSKENGPQQVNVPFGVDTKGCNLSVLIKF